MCNVAGSSRYDNEAATSTQVEMRKQYGEGQSLGGGFLTTQCCKCEAVVRCGNMDDNCLSSRRSKHTLCFQQLHAKTAPERSAKDTSRMWDAESTPRAQDNKSCQETLGQDGMLLHIRAHKRQNS
jgi:hypothetical protein